MSCKITEMKDGPLEFEFDKQILHDANETLDVKSPAYLCRCGASANKPFCDGAHKNISFTDKREIAEEIVQNYKGNKIDIIFNRSICAGAGECVRNLPTVFKSGDSSSWIYPNNDTNEKIIEIIKMCPSGALSYELEGKLNIDGRSEAKIFIVKNGPYNVEAIDFNHLAKPSNFSTTKYSLCRCGHSKNKPYCDYSHGEKNWDDLK